MPAPSDVALLEQSLGAFTFDGGRTVADARFTYDIAIPAGPSAGLVIICPSLTGTPGILRGWWRAVGPADAQARYTTLYAHGFAPATTAAFARHEAPSIRDIARGIVRLAQVLALPSATFVTGGSLGGMIALEVGLESEPTTHALVLAAPAVQTAWGAGWNHVQLQALALGGDVAGYDLARAVGMMTYRTEREFEQRFGADRDLADDQSMASYLRYHGEKLRARFDVREYEQRVRAMDTHDAGRGRGGWREAIRPHAHRISAAGITGDALYSAEVVEAWCRATGAAFSLVTSIHGHDAFLLEARQVRTIIQHAFTRATADATATALLD